MELGEKILRARQEAGLSQRQLCGATITRSMLSQIEHGTARPSMDTLKILAQRLGKPMSFFLEEEGTVTLNASVMEAARRAHGAKDAAGVLAALENYRGPDDIFDREYGLLTVLSRLELAEAALRDGKIPYAKALMEQLGEISYEIPGLSRKKALLEAKLTGNCSGLPSLDEELLLRARDALAHGRWSRSMHLLEAMEDHESPQWQLLRGEIYLREANWQAAARCFHKAETDFPEKTAGKLEICYRELGDFKQAYFYACKQKR